MSKAFLLGFVDPDTLKLVEAGIYGESEQTVTVVDSKLVPVRIHQTQARDFHQARLDLIEDIKHPRSFKRWGFLLRVPGWDR